MESTYFLFDKLFVACYTLNMEKTIACISTPLGRGAIAVVRMSGSESMGIAKKLFSCKNLDYQNITPRFMYLGNFNLGAAQEKCFMVYFKAPYSYTGEDMIEFQVHGGMLLAEKVLQSLLDNGASLAEPGELSKRAFENGKISLDEAESIIGEINAESEGELTASLMTAGGALKERVGALQEILTNTLAEIEATLDYPEEDFETETKQRLFGKITDVKHKISDIIAQSKNAKYINFGVNIAIIGTPNVGKSSLLNALLGQDRAIVTEIEGTTRDSITESISYRGIKFNFIDTAGIRDTSDLVEKIGVEKSRQFLTSSDIVLLVLDGSKKLSVQDKSLFNDIKKQNHLIVINKCDQKRVIEHFQNEIEISALNKTNINELLNLIYDKVIDEQIDFNKLIITNARQIEALNESAKVIDEILDSSEESMDVIAMLIKSLWQKLGKITGQTENEEIIDLIFSKFCLGK